MELAPFAAYIALTFVAAITPGPAVLLVMAQLANPKSVFTSRRSAAWRERLSGGALVAVGASIAAVKRAG
jgi:threonine/homoserine/homoserine lactone efflux protein